MVSSSLLLVCLCGPTASLNSLLPSPFSLPSAHPVLFKFKPGTTSAQRSQIVSEQRSLFSSVPGLEKVRVGEVLPAPTNGGFEIALCCEFESLQAWERFVGDAKHQR